MDAKTVETVLDVIEHAIAPKTLEGVKTGSKLFGAAILRKSDQSVVVAATNDEIQNPLWHGEVSAINAFFAQEEHPNPKDCVFVATHEPCSLCLSAITWAGFDNFCYLFTHEDSRKAFSIPYDIDIIQSVFQVADPGSSVDPNRDLYNRHNKYFMSTSLKQEIARLNNPNLFERLNSIEKLYSDLSAIYQKSKGRLILA